jgi:8-oxo-dGTP diphosphatase
LNEETGAVIFNIKSFHQELHSEMEKIVLLDELPVEWTYPLIQPLLVKEFERRIKSGRIELYEHLHDLTRSAMI